MKEKTANGFQDQTLVASLKNEDEMIDYLKVNLKMDKRSPEHKFKYTIKYLRGNKMNNELQPKQAIWGKKKSGNDYQDILFGSTVLTLIEKNDKWGYFTYDDNDKIISLLEDSDVVQEYSFYSR